MTIFRYLILLIVFTWSSAFSLTALAYQVEAQSNHNHLVVLLRNPNGNDAFGNLQVQLSSTGIVEDFSPTLVPATIAANTSDIIEVHFAAAANAVVGDEGELYLNVSGEIDGRTLAVDLVVPIEIVNTAVAIQGAVGSGTPQAYAGEPDSDGDGISDTFEQVFGSSPNDANSQPEAQETVLIDVPAAGGLALLVCGLALVVISKKKNSAQRKSIFSQQVICLSSGFLLLLLSHNESSLSSGNASTRIQLFIDLPLQTQGPTLLSASASASTTGPAGSAALTVDGNLSTRWESVHGIDPSWLSLDFGAEFALSHMDIHWEAANSASYEVQCSNDNINWQTIVNQSGGTFGNRTDQLTLAGSYRYLRIYGISRTSVYGYSIWEVEVYGSIPADRDLDGIDDNSDLCPDSPIGTIINSQGCLLIDSDGDGIENYADQCPGTQAGAAVDGSGCKIIIPGNEVSTSNGILVAGPVALNPGFTLYVFDNDLGTPGNSSCNAACAMNWPPLLIDDGVASGVNDLGIITRSDGSVQATHDGRPLYYYSGDNAPGDTNGEGVGGVWHSVPFTLTLVPLFDATTVLEPALQEDTPSALITRLADRARDRHAREDQFMQYDHYLSFYWEHRTAEIEIVDTIGKGGNTITFNVISEWPLSAIEAELRFFYRGLNTVAEYHNNGVMTPVTSLDVPGETRRHYTRSVNFNSKEGRALQVGDRLEFELSNFLAGVPNGRNNYYGTAILYIVGQGVEPFEAIGPIEDSYPMPLTARLGGDTTLNYQYSNEPDNHFMQLATNLSNINGQVFVRGRRIHHSDFGDGSHDEAAENASFPELSGLLGENYINRSCISCHVRNGRALPPATGTTLNNYVVKVGDAAGGADPQIGSVLQPLSISGAAESNVTIASWIESNGLRSPNFSFGSVIPTNYSARIAPQLVGLGLLEAIDEADVIALADENDSNGDGISGRAQLVVDAVSGVTRLGRFGWKATQPTVKQQVAAALNTDVGVMTSVFPAPDCGSSQSNCGNVGSELSDQHLEDLSAYIALLGVSARRNVDDPTALQGETLFNSAECNACHVETFQTSAMHPHAELRDQTIHPYTDLLLHDMGPGLASTLVEGQAGGSEWRTAPLWNIGLTNGVSGGEAYLHDGRARNLHEAIMWHGGEAENSRQAYEAMSVSEQQALITFLNSL